MNELQAFFRLHDNGLNYRTIHSDKAIQEMIYSPIHITHEQTPFDYLSYLSLNEDNSVYASIFIEPVGTIGFKANSFEAFFQGINDLFNSQPSSMGYVEAGHKIWHYAKHVRKGFGIDFQYLDTNLLWMLDINEEDTKSILFEEVVTGRNLFDFIKQKNRIFVGILDGIYFMNEGLEDAMMGEILYVEEVMPDFFKVLIDLSRFEEHNQWILKKRGENCIFQNIYPKNQLVETYFSYDQNIQKTEIVQLLKEEDIEAFQEEGKAYWQSKFDGDFLEYRQQ